MSPSLPKPISRWGYPIGLALAFLATFGAWYDPASFARVNAWHVGLWQSCDIPLPSLKLLSFGFAALLVIVLGVLSWRREDNRAMFTMSSILVFLAISCYIQFSVTRSSWLEYAIEGATDFQNTMYFANQLNAPLSFDNLPDNGITFKEEGILDRLLAGIYCLSYGWMLFFFASLGAHFSAWRGFAEYQGTRKPLLRLGWIFALLLLLQVAFPFVAQFEVAAGDHAAAQEKPKVAESYYRRAIANDEWYRLQPTLFLKIGQLRQSLGDDSSPTARLYLAQENAANGFYERAMDYLQSTDVSQDPSISHVLRTEIAQLATIQGEAFYQQAQFGAALHEWTLAYQAKPKQVAIYYMLGQVSFDLANYPEARQWYVLGKHQSGISVSQAVFLAGMADTYYHNGAPGTARAYYLKSFNVYYENNFRSIKSLVDDYFR